VTLQRLQNITLVFGVFCLMDLSASLVSTLWHPHGAFKALEVDSTEWPASAHGAPCATSKIPWSTSAVNPATRVDSIDPLPHPSWRIDGSANQGLSFLAVPIFLFPDLIPRRIDVFIPDQRKHSPTLRETLQSGFAFHMTDGQVSRLGISRHIVRALEIWTRSQPKFGDLYHSLPFGSRIIIENIAPSPYDMKIHIVPSHDIERQFLSFTELQRLWNFAPSVWPPRIDLSSLRLYVQVQDTVSFVKIPYLHPTQIFVFKSCVQEARFMYHEIKMLLSMGPHPNVLPKPLFIVTTKDRYGRADRVCGFIVQFFSGGNLANALSERSTAGTLQFKDQLHWARQLTAALIFINQTPAKYYSELKTDNVLLSVTKASEDVIFIDFEQAGNWMDFTAPEVNCLRCLERLAKKPEFIPETKRAHYLNLARAVGVDLSPTDPLYSNPEHGYFRAWTALVAAEREAAEVYSLGMTLWCVFEGVPTNRNSMSKGWAVEHLQEFPEFRHTPERLRHLIMECTKGYKSWSFDCGLVRRGAKIYPRGKSGLPGEPTATAIETRDAAMSMWLNWLDGMEVFLLARKRWLAGDADDADLKIIGFPRPKLQQVLDELNRF
jgi:hypothetical protein